MMREEEILEAAKECVFGDKPETSDFFDKVMIDCFCCGVKWSDKHPKEGLVSIDRVCEWLENYAELTGIDSETIKESFYKAMEE